METQTLLYSRIELMGEGAKSGKIYGNPPLSEKNSEWLERYQKITAGKMTFNTLILKNNEDLLYK